MDIYEAGQQKAARERESAARAKGATRDPRTSSGGGGFAKGTGGNEFDVPKTVKTPSTAKEMGGAQDTGEAPIEYGVNSLNYLGHMAGDDVTQEGHNVVPQSAVSKKISHLVKSEGKPQRQAVAIALNMKREGRLTKEGGYKRAKKD